MKFIFKVSLLTAVFTFYVVISASFNRQLFNFIAYDIIIPRKLTSEKFIKIQNNIVKKKQNDFFKSVYLKSYKGNYYLLKQRLGAEEKENIRKILLKNGWIDHINIIIWCLFASIVILIIIFLIKYRVSILRLMILFVIFLAGILYAFTINENIIERIHLILFGCIGFLFVKDNLENHGFFALIYCLFYGFFAATIDESFQYFLPYRIADFRDIFFGTIGSLWGGLIYFIIKLKLKKSNKNQ